ncbi:hypothetical protein [Mycolicibacterium fallax]|uniref:hypothetical protein n=1 Tax=Mycolicibacterium fallax TaxID=1793 RepID=UPI001055FD8B|nr:hypothetical protein [Mycolicibacterium fallax]HOW92970.1 hypothetical protein [Mycolicibacterium fallax]HSA39722.1 hypothetical protein [Mycobacterium sp.]
MSWLIPTLVPSLLMLGTFALERVEKLLGKLDDGERELLELIERSRPRAIGGAPANSGPPYPLMSVLDEPGLPTRVFRPAAMNPQFQPTRRTNDV